MCGCKSRFDLFGHTHTLSFGMINREDVRLSNHYITSRSLDFFPDQTEFVLKTYHMFWKENNRNFFSITKKIEQYRLYLL
jgi:hypothetical protein